MICWFQLMFCCLDITLHHVCVFIVLREQEGRELLEECLLISEKHKGLEHPSSVTHVLNIAMSHSRSKNFAEAERLLRTCWHIMLRTVGPKDQSITVPMLHLAVTLYNLDRDEEAERLALEVVRIREDAFGKESLPVGELVILFFFFWKYKALQFTVCAGTYATELLHVL